MREALFFLSGWFLASAFHLAKHLIDLRLMQTGHLTIPTSRMSGVPHNPEVAARREITEQSVERGADAIQQAAEAQGLKMSRKEARTAARQMLDAEDPLGGVS